MLRNSIWCLTIAAVFYQTSARAEWTAHIQTVKPPWSLRQYCSGYCTAYESRSYEIKWKCGSARGIMCALDCAPRDPIPLCAMQTEAPVPDYPPPPRRRDCCCCGS
jgi:hypothetical protein